MCLCIVVRVPRISSDKICVAESLVIRFLFCFFYVCSGLAGDAIVDIYSSFQCRFGIWFCCVLRAYELMLWGWENYSSSFVLYMKYVVIIAY